MDHFAAFGLSPRPWLDPDLLQQQFLELSAVQHPDKAANPEAKIEAENRFAALNESYRVLRDSRARILHLLALNGAAAPSPIQPVPENIIVFFNSIAEKTRAADELIKQRKAASSPMIKVQLFERGLAVTGELQDLLAQLAERQAASEKELRAIDDKWKQSASADLLSDLQRVAASLGFLERWQAQIQQRVAALAF